MDLCIKSESESRSVVSNFLQPHGLWNSLGQNTGVGSLSLLQGIFPTQESNPGLPHCRQILHQLSHKGSPYALKFTANNITEMRHGDTGTSNPYDELLNLWVKHSVLQ